VEKHPFAPRRERRWIFGSPQAPRANALVTVGRSVGTPAASYPGMATVADILNQKGSTTHSVGPEATVYEAIEKMVANNVGALLVMEGVALVGIVTERDYLRRIAVEGRTSKETRVAAIMTSRPNTVGLSTSVERCMQTMTERRIRHLPVMAANRVAGIVSIGDIVKSLLREQATHIEHLTEYIQGRA
jgi:CBS domain-containing protein